MRVAANHLVRIGGNGLVKGETTLLCIQRGDKGQQKQHVAQFLARVVRLSVPDGVHQFMRFLKHVIAERKRGLLLVPGAAVRGEQGFDNGPHCLQRGNRGAFAGLCRSVRGLCRRARGGMYG